MKKFKKHFYISLLLILTHTYTFAQFTGGSGGGHSSNYSAITQLNPPLYNDLSLSQIISPSQGVQLIVNNLYDLQFIVENTGTYPLLPGDKIFFNVAYNTNAIQDTFALVNDTLNIFESITINIPQIISFSDTSNGDLCITLNGTSFAADSTISNNTLCNSLSVANPSGISNNSLQLLDIYYDNKNQNIIIFNTETDTYIQIYSIMGKLLEPTNITRNYQSITVFIPVKQPQFVIVKITSSKGTISKKIILF